LSLCLHSGSALKRHGRGHGHGHGHEHGYGHGHGHGTLTKIRQSFCAHSV